MAKQPPWPSCQTTLIRSDRRPRKTKRWPERIAIERLLHRQRQATDPLAHVGVPGRRPTFAPLGSGIIDKASSTRRSALPSTSRPTRRRRPFINPATRFERRTACGDSAGGGGATIDRHEGREASSQQTIAGQATPPEHQAGTHGVAPRHIGNPRTRNQRLFDDPRFSHRPTTDAGARPRSEPRPAST